jgi:hypothetical protein
MPAPRYQGFDLAQEAHDLGLVAAHGSDQILRIGMFQAGLGMGVLEVQIVNRPVQRVAFGLRGLGGLFVSLLPGFQGAQLFLQCCFVAICCRLDGLLQSANGFAQRNGGIAFAFRPLPVWRGNLDGSLAFGGEIHLPGLWALLAGVPPSQCRGKLIKLEWCSLGVLLPAFGKRQFVVPDGVSGAAAFENSRLAGISV